MKVSKLKMITSKTATANQWNELMLYLRQHYKADMIELSDYLTDYDYDDIHEALIEYGIDDWLSEQGLLHSRGAKRNTSTLQISNLIGHITTRLFKKVKWMI